MTTSWVAGLANPIRRKAARKGEGALVPVLKGLPLPAAWNFKFPSPLMLSKALGLSFDCRSGRALRELGHALLGNGRGGYFPAGDDCRHQSGFGQPVADRGPDDDRAGASRYEKVRNRDAEDQAHLAQADR